MRFRTVLLIFWAIVAAAFTPMPTFAQLSSSTADFRDIKYDTHNGQKDSTFIFAFYAPKPSLLKAQSLDGAVADFEWYRFDYATKALIATPIKVEQNVTSSEMNGLAEDGYLVKITQGASVDTLKAWIFLDVLKIDDIFIDNTCSYLKLTAKAQYRTNYDWCYFADASDPQPRYYQNNFKMVWGASTDIRAGVPASNAWQNVTRSLTTTIEEPAPLKSAVYSVSMTNVFGNIATAKTAQISYMAVYADFDVLRPNEDDIYTPVSNYKGEALYKVKFKNKSINADVFSWVGYGNQLINFERNTKLWESATQDIDKEVEYRPGVYPVDLSVKSSTTGCTAATSQAEGERVLLTVEPSSLDPESIPNAFSPNGDGRNDYFAFVTGKLPVSLESIDVKIFNRNGLLVYKYNGSANDWKGWNGKVMGDKGDCTTGVYYYIISATGWDNVSYSGKSYTGSVHLFR